MIAAIAAICLPTSDVARTTKNMRQSRDPRHVSACIVSRPGQVVGAVVLLTLLAPARRLEDAKALRDESLMWRRGKARNLAHCMLHDREFVPNSGTNERSSNREKAKRAKRAKRAKIGVESQRSQLATTFPSRGLEKQDMDCVG